MARQAGHRGGGGLADAGAGSSSRSCPRIAAGQGARLGAAPHGALPSTAIHAAAAGDPCQVFEASGELTASVHSKTTTRIPREADYGAYLPMAFPADCVDVIPVDPLRPPNKAAGVSRAARAGRGAARAAATPPLLRRAGPGQHREEQQRGQAAQVQDAVLDGDRLPHDPGAAAAAAGGGGHWQQVSRGGAPPAAARREPPPLGGCPGRHFAAAAQFMRRLGGMLQHRFPVRIQVRQRCLHRPPAQARAGRRPASPTAAPPLTFAFCPPARPQIPIVWTVYIALTFKNFKLLDSEDREVQADFFQVRPAPSSSSSASARWPAPPRRAGGAPPPAGAQGLPRVHV